MNKSTADNDNATKTQWTLSTMVQHINKTDGHYLLTISAYI